VLKVYQLQGFLDSFTHIHKQKQVFLYAIHPNAINLANIWNIPRMQWGRI